MDNIKRREAYVSFDRAVRSFQAEKLEVRGLANVVDVMHEQRQGSAEVRNLEWGIRSGSWQANVDVEFHGAPGTRRRDPMGRLCNTQVVNNMFIIHSRVYIRTYEDPKTPAVLGGMQTADGRV